MTLRRLLEYGALGEIYYRQSALQIQSNITKINKLINLQKNNICPITLEYFLPNCTYTVCVSCSYNYDFMALEKWLINNNICPICKIKWANIIEYTNL
jgi:hypothetical protein